jgi:hypothetical protein
MKKKFLCFLFLLVMPLFSRAETDQRITVHVQIETYQETLFNGEIEMTPCLNDQNATTETLNAFCAVEQIANLKKWSLKKTWYPFGASLDGLSSFESDFANNRFWLYFVNEEPGNVSLNSYILQSGDQLLLSYGILPLRISTTPTNPSPNATTTIAVSYFDVNNWIWQTAQGATLIVNGVPNESGTNGDLNLFLKDDSNYTISAKLNGFLDSKIVDIVFKKINKVDSGSEVGGIWIPPVPPKDFSVSDAVAFISNKINADGTFGNAMYDDWVAIALGSLENNFSFITEKVVQNITKHPIRENAPLTDYERRAMALMALGQNPYRNNGVNYIQKILDGYDGKQFGDPNLINDDIFAIIPLVKADISPSDKKIISSAKYILSFQKENGSFGSPDLTASAIQAFLLLPASEEISDSIKRANLFLRNSQKSDGGWENTFSTSWVLQSIYAMEEKLENWKKDSGSPLNFLGSHQAEDGGMDINESPTSRLWATAYALPAAVGKPWAKILKSFKKDEFGTEKENVIEIKESSQKEIGRINKINGNLANTASVMASQNLTVGKTLFSRIIDYIKTITWFYP